MLGPRLLLVFAVLATLVLLGCWDGRRQMQRVQDEGYQTVAEVTGAQYQRTLPFAADGWRPRFVEQALSIDLKWEGKDGKPHTHRKVPVTDHLARAIVANDQVRLVSLPVKVLDDELAVPVLLSDAAERLVSLQSWSSWSGYLALAAWAGFAAMALLRRREAGVAVDLPPRRTIAGVVLLFGGAVMAFQAWSEQGAHEAAVQRGTAATADIVDVMAGPNGHAVRLSWKDGQGAVRRVGPVPISEAYWRRITHDGAAVKQASIRYREEEAQGGPVIVDDVPERGWLQQAVGAVGLALMMIGAGCLFSAIRQAQRGGRR